MYSTTQKEAKNLFYQAQRAYGRPAYIREPVVNTMDTRTGSLDRRFRTYFLRRLVLVPSDKHNNFIYDLTYLAANKNFAYGGIFTQGTFPAIVNLDDIPRDRVITIEWDVVIDKISHQLISVNVLGDSRIAILALKKLESTEPINVEDYLP